jgi:hypothetical protein
LKWVETPFIDEREAMKQEKEALHRKEEIEEHLAAETKAGEKQPLVETAGTLSSIASKVLMKVLYAGRLARWDLLRAIGFLATQITKWTIWSDRRLHRVMCYVNSTLSMRMINWVSESDSLEDLDFHAWADADFAGADLSKRSTNGGLAGILGPNSWVGISPVSKKQTAVSHSTPEAEIVAADHMMRTETLPLLDVLDVLLGRKVIPTLHEDNETAPGVIKTGKLTR